MSLDTVQTYKDYFVAEVHRLYESNKTLRQFVTLKTGVEGKTAQFPVAGGGIAVPAARGKNITPMNQAREMVMANLSGWDAYDYVYGIDQLKISYDDISVTAAACLAAINRREMQLILDAIKDKCSSANDNVLDENDIFTVDVLSSAKEYFDDNNVDEEDRYIALTAHQQRQLRDDARGIDSDTLNDVKAWLRGTLPVLYGFHLQTISGKLKEGGLPASGSGASAKHGSLAWHKQAVGLAVCLDKKASMDWIPEKKGYFTGMTYDAGAVGIDKLGLLRVNTLDTASV
jgi:hypothetical protein